MLNFFNIEVGVISKSFFCLIHFMSTSRPTMEIWLVPRYPKIRNVRKMLRQKLLNFFLYFKQQVKLERNVIVKILCRWYSKSKFGRTDKYQN